MRICLLSHLHVCAIRKAVVYVKLMFFFVLYCHHLYLFTALSGFVYLSLNTCTNMLNCKISMCLFFWTQSKSHSHKDLISFFLYLSFRFQICTHLHTITVYWFHTHSLFPVKAAKHTNTQQTHVRFNVTARK